MPQLISELKDEHLLITDLMLEALNTGLNTEDGKKLIYDTKSLLLSHLQKEDTRLYPILLEEAKTDQNLKEILDSYDKKMQEISNSASLLFQLNETNTDNTKFSIEFENFYTLFAERISNEESVLYKKYCELNNS